MKVFWIGAVMVMGCLLTLQTSDLALSVIKNPPNAFYAPLSTGQTISYDIDNPDDASLTIQFLDASGSTVESETYNSGIIASWVATEDTQTVRVSTTSTSIVEYSLDLELVDTGQTLSAASGDKIIAGLAIASFQPQHSQTYSFSPEAGTFSLLDSTGSVIAGADTLTALTTSSIYYLALDIEGDPNNVQDIDIVISICQHAYRWDVSVCVLDCSHVEQSAGSDGSGGCNCNSGYLWVTEDQINDCRLEVCMNDPNSPGTSSRDDNCDCNLGYQWDTRSQKCDQIPYNEEEQQQSEEEGISQIIIIIGVVIGCLVVLIGIVGTMYAKKRKKLCFRHRIMTDKLADADFTMIKI